MLQEFRDFINRGNFVEFAVAFVLGLAFNTVVQAVVNDVIMPAIGLIFGEPDFDRIGRFGCEQSVDQATGQVVDQCAGSIGAVLTALVNLLLVGVALFLIVKAYNRFKARTAEPEEGPIAEPAEEVVLLREIRDRLPAAPSEPSPARGPDPPEPASPR